MDGFAPYYPTGVASSMNYVKLSPCHFGICRMGWREDVCVGGQVVGSTISLEANNGVHHKNQPLHGKVNPED